jgi:hypothetical protein
MCIRRKRNTRNMFGRKSSWIIHLVDYVLYGIVKVKESRNRPGVVQRVPGVLGSQISMAFGTWKWWSQPHSPAVFTPRECSSYSFLLGAESTPGPWYGRKEYVTEKSRDTTGNRSRDRTTSSAVPLTTMQPQAPVWNSNVFLNINII